MHQIIRLPKTTQIKHATFVYYTNIDLHTTRHLYLHSSVLASYDTLSNLEMDTEFKNLFVRLTIH